MTIINRKITIAIYETDLGKLPFEEWFKKLEPRTKKMIRMRLRRVGQGNFGNCGFITGKLKEIKFYDSPGYRIYYGHLDLNAIILLCAGNKGTQTQDIEKAKQCLEDVMLRGESYAFKKNYKGWLEKL